MNRAGNTLFASIALFDAAFRLREDAARYRIPGRKNANHFDAP